MKNALIEIFYRDFEKLKEEISFYNNPADLWIITGEINNSAGNLCLHLIGNMNHFIGAVLGKNGYVRKRDEEFSAKNISLQELVTFVEHTKEVVIFTLSGLEDEDFLLDFPEKKHDRSVKTDFMLMHLLTHFNYHLGQINYHRRLLTSSSAYA